MNFTAKVNLVKNSSGQLKAFASLIVNDTFCVDGFKVIESKTGDLFVGYPSHKGKDAEGNEKWYNDVAFFEDVPEGSRRGPVAESAMAAILNEYNRTASGQSRTQASRSHSERPNPGNARPNTRRQRDPVDW